MTLQQLRTFLAIVEFGSFRRAARELDVSQAGLTTSIQALENELKLRLIVRSTHGITLTAEGRQIYERAQIVDRESRQILSDADRLRGKSGGHLSIGLGPTPTATLLHHVVPDFHKRFPDVRLNLTSGVYEHLESALQQGKVELAITAVPGEGVSPNLTSVELFRSDLAVIAREDHPLAGADSIRELLETEWVLLGSPGGPGGTVTQYHIEHGLPAPLIAATCESLTQLAALVRGTDWMAVIPAVMIDRGLMGDGLATLKLQEAVPRYVNSVVYRREPPLSPAAQAFVAMCRSCARALALGVRP
ncbi:MAG: LysR family transcriptional regulator [Hydrogenophaga sp.]|uniref:LysR family transcriptional regulator n=1 Tax=Hydrogenophaga sp. TaxID=1904254 RepID=UPI0040358ED4